MASVNIISDDLDGTPDATTRTFTISGKTHAIDLSDKNNARLVKALTALDKALTAMDEFTSVSQTGNGKSYPRNEQAMATRAWAKSQGLTVPDRGRLSSEIMEAFRTAQEATVTA